MFLDGDPRFLSLFLPDPGVCDPIINTLYWPVTNANAPAGECILELKNETTIPIFLADAIVTGANFVRTDAEALGRILAPNDIVNIRVAAVAPSSGVAAGELILEGARPFIIPLLVDAASATPSIVARGDARCGEFGGVDRFDASEDNRCRWLLVNVGPTTVSVSSATRGGSNDFAEALPLVPLNLPSRAAAGFSVFAFSNGAARTSSGQLTWSTSAGTVVVPFSATFADPALGALPTTDCVVGGGINLTTSCVAGALSIGQGTSVEVVARLENTSSVQAFVTNISFASPQPGRVSLGTGAVTPFLIDPGQSRLINVIVTPGASTGSWTGDMFLDDLHGRELAVVHVSGSTTQ